MPWSIGDVDKHMKGLSDKQKRMWVQVANSALATCQKKNGSNCDASAIRQANSVVGKASHTEGFCAPGAVQPIQVEFVASDPLFTDTEDEYVLRSGLLFRAGTYQDKDFAMTPEELQAAVEKFDQPVPIDLEHMPTILDGKLGEVLSIEAFGDELHGIVRLPTWLDNAIGSGARKVSATWLRATKELVGLALCLNPRVEDAALMSAYAGFAAKRHDTPHGRMALQDIHDSSARAGAVCKQPSDKAGHASRHENQAIQQIHDLASQHGAKCHAMDPNKDGPAYMPYTLTQADAEALALGFGSSAGSNPAPAAPRKESHMGWKDKLIQAITGLPDDLESSNETGAAGEAVASGTAQHAAPPAPAARDDAELTRMRQERDAAQTELRRVRAERIESEAQAFASLMVSEGRVFPAEREALVSAYSVAAADDVNFGTVEMGDGSKVTRVSILKKAYESRPQHQLDLERIAPEIKALLTVKETTTPDPNAPMSAERRAELLGKTPSGQRILNGTSKN